MDEETEALKERLERMKEVMEAAEEEKVETTD